MRMILWLFLVLSVGAVAQPAGEVVRVRGTVGSLSGEVLTVMGEDGAVMVALPPGVRIGALVERSLADLRPGEFVGSAAVRGRDGRMRAQEVHIFPEALRGSGEGHRPMAEPEQTMTNATVGEVAGTAEGRSIRLRYPGGEQVIEVGPGIRVVGMIPGDRTLLVPGAAVTVRAAKGTDGALTAVSVQAEKDGVKPLP